MVEKRQLGFLLVLLRRLIDRTYYCVAVYQEENCSLYV